MQEMDRVEVLVEKPEYARYGVHKGMQGWICMEGQPLPGYWLVNFPQCGEHEDIATEGIFEEDLKLITVMHAAVNERIREEWEAKDKSKQ